MSTGTDEIQSFPTYRPVLAPMETSCTGSDILDFSDASLELKARSAGMALDASIPGIAEEEGDVDMILEDSETERAQGELFGTPL